MWRNLGISELDWQLTPAPVQHIVLSLSANQHAFSLRAAGYQQQLATRTTEIAQLERERLAQAAEIERLTAEVAKLRERLAQNSTNSTLPPSSDSPFGKPTNKAAPSGRKQGAQVGHRGAGRYLLDVDQVDQVVELRPTSCTRCACRVLEQDWLFPARRQVTEITIAGTMVTEYQRFALRCVACGRRNRAAWSEEALGGAFGARVKAVVAYLTGRLHLSHRDVVEAMNELFQVKMAAGSIAAVQNQISQALTRPVAHLQQLVENAPVLYVDETSWRQKDTQPWLWVSVSEKATVFQILAGRKTTDAQTIIGENSTGIITSDRYPSYNYLDVQRRQICWAHLKRDFARIAERDGAESKEIGEGLLDQIKGLFELWRRVRDGTLARAAFELSIEPIKRQVNRLLVEGTLCSQLKTARTCCNILKLEQSLWTFARVDGVEPTNNRAERALRRAVLWRRKSFGTQSDAGSRFVARILTVVTTLRQQGRSVLEYLRQAAVSVMGITERAKNVSDLDNQTSELSLPFSR